jgi:hypothetical protein
MGKTITTTDPEFADILAELTSQSDAVRKRQQLGEESFRVWLYKEIGEIAQRLGYIVQDFAEFIKDMGFGFREGYSNGREEARRNSLRAREERKL